MFVLWGVMHGTMLSIHRVWSKYAKLKMPLVPAQIITFLFVVLAWVPFRAETTELTMKIYRGLFVPVSFKFNMPALFDIMLFVAGFVIILFMPTTNDLCKKFKPTWCSLLFAVGLTVVSMFLFVKVSPFIYFNF